VSAAAQGTGALTAGEAAGLGLPPESAAVVEFLSAPGPEVDRLEKLVRALGPGWARWCPIGAAGAARRLLSAWCDQGRWDEGLALADGLTRAGLGWAAELAALVRVRRALERGAGGELDEADRDLAALEAEGGKSPLGGTEGEP
jgi:hypothetical protein